MAEDTFVPYNMPTTQARGDHSDLYRSRHSTPSWCEFTKIFDTVIPETFQVLVFMIFSFLKAEKEVNNKYLLFSELNQILFLQKKINKEKINRFLTNLGSISIQII